MELRRKIVIVGDKGCGKTSLVALFRGDPFDEKYEPTFYDSKKVEIRTKIKEKELIASGSDGGMYGFLLCKHSAFIRIFLNWVEC